MSLMFLQVREAEFKFIVVGFVPGNDEVALIHGQKGGILSFEAVDLATAGSERLWTLVDLDEEDERSRSGASGVRGMV